MEKLVVINKLISRNERGFRRMTEKKDSKRSPKETGGPIVKSGPTAGQNRARNADGSWRKKTFRYRF